jgi:outer membrane protein assembly factor BamE (lipoprotein component of BamABCDE complex)
MVGNFRILCACLLSLLVCGCQNTDASRGRNAENVTIGTVQRNIYVGMRSADVVAVLGSPNMVTKDTKGNETWVYDKIHSESEVKASGGYLTLFLFGGSQAKGSHLSSERTLTIIIHFDEDSRVQNFSYRTTTF